MTTSKKELNNPGIGSLIDKDSATHGQIDDESMTPEVHQESLVGGENVNKRQSDHLSAHEKELRRLLERDARRSEAKYGNAIEKQKNRMASGANAPVSGTSHLESLSRASAKPAATEFEYHPDRILMAVLIGLVALSLLSWGAYLLFSGSSDSADQQAYETLSDAGNIAPVADEAVSANAESVDTINSEAAADEAANIEAALANLETADAEAPAAAPVDASEAAEATSNEVAPVAPNEQTALNSEQPAAIAATERPEALTAPEQPELTTAAVDNTANPASDAESVNNVPAAATAPATPEAESAADPINSAPTDAGILVPDAIARMNLAQGVQSFEPVGVFTGGQISLAELEGSRLFFFTQITNMAEQTVAHKWYFEGQEVAQIEINVGSSSWRASTNKLITPNTLGAWRVDAVDANGRVLASQPFEMVQ